MNRMQKQTHWEQWESFLWGHWYPCFRLLMMSALGFKARMDPSLSCFPTYMQRISQVHSGTTPADLLMANMVAEPFWSIYLHMCRSRWEWNPWSSIPHHNAVNHSATPVWSNCLTFMFCEFFWKFSSQLIFIPKWRHALHIFYLLRKFDSMSVHQRNF